MFQEPSACLARALSQPLDRRDGAETLMGAFAEGFAPWEETSFWPSHAYSQSTRTFVVTVGCSGLGFCIMKCDNGRDLSFVRPRESRAPTGEMQLPRSARGAGPSTRVASAQAPLLTYVLHFFPSAFTKNLLPSQATSIQRFSIIASIHYAVSLVWLGS